MAVGNQRFTGSAHQKVHAIRAARCRQIGDTIARYGSGQKWTAISANDAGYDKRSAKNRSRGVNLRRDRQQAAGDELRRSASRKGHVLRLRGDGQRAGAAAAVSASLPRPAYIEYIGISGLYAEEGVRRGVRRKTPQHAGGHAKSADHPNNTFQKFVAFHATPPDQLPNKYLRKL